MSRTEDKKAQGQKTDDVALFSRRVDLRPKCKLGRARRFGPIDEAQSKNIQQHRHLNMSVKRIQKIWHRQTV